MIDIILFLFNDLKSYLLNKMNNDLQVLIKQGKITSLTLDRVNIAKSYIEKKYSMKKTQEEEKKRGKVLLNIIYNFKFKF